jgi:hypothetical protein
MTHQTDAAVARTSDPALGLLLIEELTARLQAGERVDLTGTLGDFRLLREVGRGGMGVLAQAPFQVILVGEGVAGPQGQCLTRERPVHIPPMLESSGPSLPFTVERPLR